MKQKAWMHNIVIAVVLSLWFGNTLPAKEATVLDLTQPSDSAQLVALALNYKAVNGCVLLFKTAELMNKVIEEQADNKDWPGGNFTRIWERIKEDEKPDDDMAEFELDGKLRRITLSKKKDPKDLLVKILAVEIKFGITIVDKKKIATILRALKRDYAQVMTTMSTITKHTAKREATPKEMVVAVYKQWRLQGNKESTHKKVEDDGHETALADVKKARWAQQK